MIGVIANPEEHDVAREFPDVTVGSYPHMERRELVIRLRGDDPTAVDAAAARLRELRADA